jgi:hypothetical protein
MAKPARRLEQNSANRELEPVTVTNNRETGTIGRPVSRSDVFRDFARGAPFQRHGSQRPKSLHRIKPWPQKNCKFPVLGN